MKLSECKEKGSKIITEPYPENNDSKREIINIITEILSRQLLSECSSVFLVVSSEQTMPSLSKNMFPGMQPDEICAGQVAIKNQLPEEPKQVASEIIGNKTTEKKGHKSKSNNKKTKKKSSTKLNNKNKIREDKESLKAMCGEKGDVVEISDIVTSDQTQQNADDNKLKALSSTTKTRPFLGINIGKVKKRFRNAVRKISTKPVSSVSGTNPMENVQTPQAPVILQSHNITLSQNQDDNCIVEGNNVEVTYHEVTPPNNAEGTYQEVTPPNNAEETYQKVTQPNNELCLQMPEIVTENQRKHSKENKFPSYTVMQEESKVLTPELFMSLSDENALCHPDTNLPNAKQKSCHITLPSCISKRLSRLADAQPTRDCSKSDLKPQSPPLISRRSSPIRGFRHPSPLRISRLHSPSRSSNRQTARDCPKNCLQCESQCTSPSSCKCSSSRSSKKIRCKQRSKCNSTKCTPPSKYYSLTKRITQKCFESKCCAPKSCIPPKYIVPKSYPPPKSCTPTCYTPPRCRTLPRCKSPDCCAPINCYSPPKCNTPPRCKPSDCCNPSKCHTPSKCNTPPRCKPSDCCNPSKCYTPSTCNTPPRCKPSDCCNPSKCHTPSKCNTPPRCRTPDCCNPPRCYTPPKCYTPSKCNTPPKCYNPPKCCTPPKCRTSSRCEKPKCCSSSKRSTPKCYTPPKRSPAGHVNSYEAVGCMHQFCKLMDAVSKVKLELESTESSGLSGSSNSMNFENNLISLRTSTNNLVCELRKLLCILESKQNVGPSSGAGPPRPSSGAGPPRPLSRAGPPRPKRDCYERVPKYTFCGEGANQPADISLDESCSSQNSESPAASKSYLSNDSSLDSNYNNYNSDLDQSQNSDCAQKKPRCPPPRARRPPPSPRLCGQEEGPPLFKARQCGNYPPPCNYSRPVSRGDLCGRGRVVDIEVPLFYPKERQRCPDPRLTKQHFCRCPSEKRMTKLKCYNVFLGEDYEASGFRGSDLPNLDQMSDDSICKQLRRVLKALQKNQDQLTFMSTRTSQHMLEEKLTYKAPHQQNIAIQTIRRLKLKSQQKKNNCNHNMQPVLNICPISSKSNLKSNSRSFPSTDNRTKLIQNLQQSLSLCDQVRQRLVKQQNLSKCDQFGLMKSQTQQNQQLKQRPRIRKSINDSTPSKCYLIPDATYNADHGIRQRLKLRRHASAFDPTIQRFELRQNLSMYDQPRDSSALRQKESICYMAQQRNKFLEIFSRNKQKQEKGLSCCEEQKQIIECCNLPKQRSATSFQQSLIDILQQVQSSSSCSQQPSLIEIIQQEPCCSQQEERQNSCQKQSSSCCSPAKSKLQRRESSTCCQPKSKQSLLQKLSSKCCKRSKQRHNLVQKRSSICCIQPKPLQIVLQKQSSSCCSQLKPTQCVVQKRSRTCCELPKLRKSAVQKHSSMCCSQPNQRKRAVQKRSSSCCSQLKLKRRVVQKCSSRCCNQPKPRKKRSPPCCSQPKPRKQSSPTCCSRSRLRQIVAQNRSSSSSNQSEGSVEQNQSSTCCNNEPKPIRIIVKKRSSTCSHSKPKQNIVQKQCSTCCSQPKPRQCEVQKKNSTCCNQPKPIQIILQKKSPTCCSQPKPKQCEVQNRNPRQNIQKKRSPTCCSYPKQGQNRISKSYIPSNQKQYLRQEPNSTCCNHPNNEHPFPQKRYQHTSNHDNTPHMENVTDCVQELRCKILKLTKLLNALECNQRKETCKNENSIAALKEYTRRIRSTIRQILSQAESNENEECPACREENLLRQQKNVKRHSQDIDDVEGCDEADKRSVICGQKSDCDPADVEVIKTCCGTSNPLLMRRTGYKGVEARRPPGATRPHYHSFVATPDDYAEMVAEEQRLQLEKSMLRKASPKKEDDKSSICSTLSNKCTNTVQDDVICCSSLDQRKDIERYQNLPRSKRAANENNRSSSKDRNEQLFTDYDNYDLEDEESSYSLPKRRDFITNRRGRVEKDEYDFDSTDQNSYDVYEKHTSEYDDDDRSFSPQRNQNTFNNRKKFQETLHRLDLLPWRDPKEDPRISFLPLTENLEVNRQLKKEVAEGRRDPLKWSDSNYSLNNKNMRLPSTHRVHYSDEDDIYYAAIGEKSTACQCDLPCSAISDMSDDDLRQKCHGFTYDDLDTIYKRDLFKLKSKLTQVTSGFKFKKNKIESYLVPKKINSKSLKASKVNITENSDEGKKVTPYELEKYNDGDVVQDTDEKKIAYSYLLDNSYLSKDSHKKDEHDTKKPFNFFRLKKKKNNYKLQEKVDLNDVNEISLETSKIKEPQNDIVIVETMSNSNIKKYDDKNNYLYRLKSSEHTCKKKQMKIDNNQSDDCSHSQRIKSRNCETCGDKLCPGLGPLYSLPRKKILITGPPEIGTHHPTCSCISKEEYDSKCKEKAQKCECNKKQRRSKSICECPKSKKCPKDITQNKETIIQKSPEKIIVEKKIIQNPPEQIERQIYKNVEPIPERKIEERKRARIIEPDAEKEIEKHRQSNVIFNPVVENNVETKEKKLIRVELVDDETQTDEMEFKQRYSEVSENDVLGDVLADACECRRRVDACECDKVDCGCAGADDERCKCSEMPPTECCENIDQIMATGFKLTVKKNPFKSLFC